MDKKIDENSYSYSRFIIHMRYLIKRCQNNVQISSDNKLLYDLMKVRYPDTYRCTLKIEEYFETKMNWKCDKEELLYLMIHINRLCS